MISSGQTAVATTLDTAVTVLTGTGWYNRITVINEGAVAGFVSVDGGLTWTRLRAGPYEIPFHGPFLSPTVQVKRIPAGTNLTGIWAYAE